MNQVLLSRHRGGRGLGAILGTTITFALAVGFSIIASEQQEIQNRVIPIGISALLFATGFRSLLLRRRHRGYVFLLGSEQITCGPAGRPRRQQVVYIEDISQIDWRSDQTDGRVQIHLKSGDTIGLPLGRAGLLGAELRPLIEKHFPAITSID